MVEIGGGGERGRERIRRRAYEWISSYAAGAVRLKLRSDFTYRTPRPYTYVLEVRYEKKKRERETGVFSFPVGSY